MLKFLSISILLAPVLFCLKGNCTVTNEFKSEIFKITKNVEFHEDLSGLKTFENVKDVRFSSIGEDFFRTGLPVRHPIWFKFSVKNASDEKLWLLIKNSLILSLDLYKIDISNDSVTDHIFYSCRVNSERFLDYRPKFFLNQPGETHEFYVRIMMTRPHLYPFIIGTKDQVNYTDYSSNYIGLVFLGGMAIIFFYNLFLLVFWRSKIYLTYCLYLIVVTIASLYLNDLPILKEFYLSKLIFDHPFVLFCFTPILALIFARIYLKLDLIEKFTPFYYIMIAYLLGIGISNLFVSTSIIMIPFEIGGVLTYLLALIGGIIAVRNKIENSIIYIIGWSFMFLAFIPTVIASNGYVPYSYAVVSILYIGVFFEVLIFSIGLVSMIKQLKEEQGMLNLKLFKSNEKYRTLNESLDSFNYHVSHDLKTVMNNVTGLLIMAKKYSNDEKRLTDILNRLDKVNRSGVETINGFLELASIDAVAEEPIKEINLREFIRKLVDDHDLDSKVTVAFEKFDSDIVELREKALESILINLITNSIKYCEYHPVIRVSFQSDEKFNVIRLSDNGIGIDLEKHGEDLFSPFKRIQNNLGKEGTGIGLYIVKKAVMACNGRIQVMSTPGKGTTFELYFEKNPKAK